MQYMLLIYGDENGRDSMSEEERGQVMQAYMAYDGPFAETKEQLGGYYLIEAGSLDEALGWAEKLPGSRHGSVEVRPVMVFEGDGS